MSRTMITEPNQLATLLPTFYNRPFAFDVETTGIDWEHDDLLGVALSFEGEESYYIVIRHLIEQADGKLIDHRFFDLLTIRHMLLGLFSQGDVLMVAHNAKFDMKFMRRLLAIEVHGRLFDTLLAGKMLDENRPNGLKELAHLVGPSYAKYTDLPTYPGYKKTEFIATPLALGADYAMSDAEATFKLYQLFSKQLLEQDLEYAYYQIWQPMIYVLMDMEYRGIAMDMAAIRKAIDTYTTIERDSRVAVRHAGLEMLLDMYDNLDDIPALYWSIYRESDYLEDADGFYVMDGTIRVPIHRPTPRSAMRILTFNPGSSQQLSDLVFKQTRVKLPPMVKLKENKKSGMISVDKDNLETILFYAGNNRPKVIEEILRWRKSSKFLSTYLRRFVKDCDPKDHYAIHTNFNQDGTDTGRLSSSYPNLQNIPSRGDIGELARSFFVARPGYKLVVADYSQMELRVMAHYSGDLQLIKAFEEQRDLHILTGAAFAQMTYDELMDLYQSGDPRGKELRQLGKTGNFALMYGMGPVKFARYLLVNNKYEISVDEAKDWIGRFNQMYEGTRTWKEGGFSPKFQREIDGVHKWVRKHGYVKTISGRYRRLPDAFHFERWIRDTACRQGVNAIIQGSCGDIICHAMIPIHYAFKQLGGSLLLQVHDELVGEVPEEHAEQAVKIMENYMMHHGLVTKLDIPLIAEAHYGDTWYSAKG